MAEGVKCAIIVKNTVSVLLLSLFSLVCGDCNCQLGTKTFKSILSAFNSTVQSGLFV